MPPPYSPQANSVAERINRIIVKGLISLLNQAQAPKALCAETLLSFVFVRNRLPHAALGGGVPLAVWRGKPVRVNMLRVWGCRAYHTITNGRANLDNKAVPLVFIGYDGDTAAYRAQDCSISRCPICRGRIALCRRHAGVLGKRGETRRKNLLSEPGKSGWNNEGYI